MEKRSVTGKIKAVFMKSFIHHTIFIIGRVACVATACLFFLSCQHKPENPKLQVPTRYAYTHVLVSPKDNARPAIRTLTIRDGENWRVELGDLSTSFTRVFLNAGHKFEKNNTVPLNIAQLANSIENLFAATQDPDYMVFLGKSRCNGRKCLKFKSLDGIFVFFDEKNFALVRRESSDWQETYTSLKLSDEKWEVAFVDTNSWLRELQHHPGGFAGH